MRYTYTSAQAQFLRNIHAVGATDANLIAEFNSELGFTYQLMLAKLKNFKTQISTNFTTVTDAVAGTSNQDYPYPPGEVSIDGVTVNIGNITYPLRIIDSDFLWQKIHAVQIQVGIFPQFYFPKRDSFGIFPTPQTTYTGTIDYHYRDRNLSVADVSGGTLTLTAGSKVLTGNGGVFTPAMVGRWFSVTDPTLAGQGYWYRIISYTNSNTLGLYQPWAGSTGTTTLYTIGESPEIPEETHMTLIDGVTAGYYQRYMKDVTNGAYFSNLFWTGDPANANREIGDSKIAAGLIGAMNRYSDRDDTHVVDRNPAVDLATFRAWGITLS